MKLQFPHFSHQISARLLFSLEMFLLWAALAALIAVNVITLQKNQPAYWDKLVMVLWNSGYKQEVRNVLGATTDFVESLTRREEEKVELQKQYAFWKSVANAHPDYRDAFITLTSLSYKLGKLEEARTFLDRAAALDPNSPVIQKFSTILK